MHEPEKFIAAIIKAAPDYKLVGRVRLQKIAYLLQKLGLKEAQALDFSYHHYGPYSEQVDSARWFADAAGLIEETRARRKLDSATYSIFEMGNAAKDLPEFPAEFAIKVQDWAQRDPIVLELAATVHWLAAEEKVEDWKKELRRRKTWKVENGRLEKALELLKELELPPAAEEGHDLAH